MTSLPLESVIQRSIGIRHQDVISGENELAFEREIGRRRNGFRSVMIVAEGKSRPRLHPMLAQDSHFLLVVRKARDVGRLLGLAQAFARDRLEPGHISPIAGTLE